MNKNSFFNNFHITDDEIKRASKYKDCKDVIECAKDIKNSAIKLNKLIHKDKQTAAIILSRELYEKEKK